MEKVIKLGFNWLKRGKVYIRCQNKREQMKPRHHFLYLLEAKLEDVAYMLGLTDTELQNWADLLN